ncbi:MAG: hypothetical protein E2P05_05315 [Acidobacteria bacterium]|nr:MAG: hypothetical protein E2P05_05315 [Acidobacteriota bacterium]
MMQNEKHHRSGQVTPVKHQSAIQEEIEKLGRTYGEEVLSGPTRVVSLPGRKCEPRILHTFLGFELQVAQKRMTCPDMSTARYLRLFAEIGMPSVRAPYDPSLTTGVLPQLEQSLKNIKDLLLEENLDRKQHQSKLRNIYRKIRENLKMAEKEIGRI